MGNLRIPAMRISSEHVAGVLRFLDRQAEAKAAPISAPMLRYPRDFPGARPNLQRDPEIMGKQGFVVIDEVAFQPVDEGAAAARESVDKAVQGESATIPSCPEGGRVNEGDQLASEPATKPVAPPQVRPAAEVAPVRVAPAPVSTVKHVQPARQAGKTAAQERLFKSLPLSSGPLRERAAAPSFTLRPDPLAERRERLTRAIGWLKREHRILVTVVDREALVRQYLVSGKRDRMLADQVVDYAVSLGMPRNG